jgi:hypothetical protein
VARAISRSRETGRVTEHFALLHEKHCRGFRTDRVHTVRSWVEEQGLKDYNRINDLLLEIIGLKSTVDPGPLSFSAQRIFYETLYNLDNFRDRVFKEGILDRFASEETLGSARLKEEALLRLAHDWVKQALFGQPAQQGTTRPAE